MDKIARMMEYFWLALGVVSTGVATYIAIAHGWAAGRVFFWFPLVCFAMFFYRRFMRKKMKEWAERREREERG